VHITRIGLRDYRNLESFELSPESALTVLVGPNGAGKTNTIEAIQILCTGSSFRNPVWEDLVRWGSGTANVYMAVEGESSPLTVNLRISRSGSRIWKVNDITKRRLSDATRFVPVVVFTPDDLSMVKGSAEQRRASIDALGEQLSVVYGSLRRDYARVVRQRNKLLRDGTTPEALRPWSAQLVALGARLHTHRRRLLRRVADSMRPAYARLSGGEELEVLMEDRCGVGVSVVDTDIDHETVAGCMDEQISTRSAQEIERRVSLVGPHRDDVVFTIGERDARSFASQGQQRTLALAWKLAEVEVVRSVMSKTPVLLLDDVMSELDQDRRAALTAVMQQDIQTFVTTTNTGYFDPALLRSAVVVDMGER
jgi:DNA replication and repair protein RecF